MSDVTATNTTPYDSDQLMYIADLRASLEDQLEAMGYDPDVFFENLDGEITLDLKSSPAYQTYLLLAYQELAYTQFGGEDLMTIYGDTSIDWTSFDTMQATMDEDLFAFLDTLTQDNPEFMAMAVTMNQGADAGNSLLAALNGELASLNTSDDEDFEYDMTKAYALMDELGVTGLEDFAEYEDTAMTISGQLMAEIANIQEYMANASSLYEGEELTAVLEGGSANLQILMVELQNVNSMLQTFTQMMSDISKSMSDTQRQIASST